MRRFNSTLNQYTPLRTKTPLRSKKHLLSYGNGLAKKPINKVSAKQKTELQKRTELKAQLIKEHGEHCMTCKDKNRDWRGITLSHIIPLSRGGKTCRENCILECFPDHELYEKHPEKRTK
jgi:5-methylcytosine-specific restriction endonuclease McrA